MFSLTTAPRNVATTLASSACSRQADGCTIDSGWDGRTEIPDDTMQEGEDRGDRRRVGAITMTEYFRLPSVSFFCPAYHDEKNLPVLIPRVHRFLSETTDTFEVIIVHDGSPDKTGEVADRLAADFPHVRVLHHRKNLGYGATLRDGFLAARYDYIMYTDGDNQYDVREFSPYLHVLQTADVLSGYVTQKAASPWRKFQSLVYNWLIAVLFFVRCRDIDCAMKIYSRKAIDSLSLKSTSCFIDAEMIIKSKRAGFKVAQFPVTHFPRTEGLASGSKMTVVAATLRDMLRFRLGVL
jgi:cellulose synthase/poly-beta-1,6-N-acetylglucosamine synthase-like glycosyltransferase